MTASPTGFLSVSALEVIVQGSWPSAMHQWTCHSLLNLPLLAPIFGPFDRSIALVSCLPPVFYWTRRRLCLYSGACSRLIADHLAHCVGENGAFCDASEARARSRFEQGLLRPSKCYHPLPIPKAMMLQATWGSDLPALASFGGRPRIEECVWPQDWL